MTDSPDQYKTCPKCHGTGGATRVSDYVRGDRTEFCSRCDGDGRLYIGPARKVSGSQEAV
jgi:DnaJ-class molecular chaperone